MNKVTRKTVYEYDAIRLIATILVVLGHSAYTTMQTSYGGLVINVHYSEVQKVILLIVRLIYSFHMPLFIFLAGALYEIGQKGGKWEAFSAFVAAKARRLLLPFVSVTIFWLLPIKYFSGYYSASNSVIKDMLLGQVVFLENCHLWYVVSLFWIFQISWIMDKFLSSRFKVAVIMGLFCVALLIPVNFLGFKKAFLYLVYFYGGKVYERKRTMFSEIDFKSRKLIISGICFFTIFIYGIYLSLFRNNDIVYSFVAFAGIGMMLLFSYLLKRKSFNMGACLPKIILKNSYGIYLFADPVNYLILSFLLRTRLITLYESGVGCLCVFVARAIITTSIALVVQKFINIVKANRKRAGRSL